MTVTTAGFSTRARRVESRRREDDVVGLPFAWRTRRVHERRILPVHRRGLAVGIGLVLIAVEHLHLELSEEEHAAVAAPLAGALDLFRRGELHVELEVGELLLRFDHALGRLQHAVLHRPAEGRLVGAHLPGARFAARAQQHGGVRRRRSRRGSGRDDARLRPRAVVNVPLAVRLHRGVFVSELRLLAANGDGGGRRDDGDDARRTRRAK